MKKTTQRSLSGRLAGYGALSAVLGLAAEANGQIIYTDINPDEGGAGVTYNLDMDNDGAPEVQFIQYNYYGIIDILYGYQNVSAGVRMIGGAGSSSSTVFGYPSVLNSGAVISAANANWNSGYYQLLNANDCGGFYGYFTGGQWCNVTDKYIGIKFMIGTNTHYGWARLDVTGSDAWTIKDYAYNATPNAPINAGQTTLSVGQSLIETVKITGLHKTVGLYNLPESTLYRVINMTGQTVLEGTASQESLVIQNPSLKTGIYVVEVTDADTGAVTRKKVML